MARSATPFPKPARQGAGAGSAPALDKGRHGAIDPIAEAEPFRFQVIESLANERRVVGQHRGRFAHYPVALFEAPYAAAGLGNITSEFMAQDTG